MNKSLNYAAGHEAGGAEDDPHLLGDPRDAAQKMPLPHWTSDLNEESIRLLTRLSTEVRGGQGGSGRGRDPAQAVSEAPTAARFDLDLLGRWGRGRSVEAPSRGFIRAYAEATNETAPAALKAVLPRPSSPSCRFGTPSSRRPRRSARTRHGRTSSTVSRTSSCGFRSRRAEPALAGGGGGRAREGLGHDRRAQDRDA